MARDVDVLGIVELVAVDAQYVLEVVEEGSLVVESIEHTHSALAASVVAQFDQSFDVVDALASEVVQPCA